MSKLNKPSALFSLGKRNAWYLWLCQLLNVSSLAIELSSWMLGVLALCFCWQALLLTKQSQKGVFVSPIILTIFAISGCIAIAISAKNLGVLISMVHLLTFAYALKAFEIKKRKDFYQHMLLGLFLLASALIFRQNIIFSILILLLVVYNLTLIHLLFAKQQTIQIASKTVLLLVLQSSFLAVILFVVFPRLSPFWQVPMANSAKTGLSDHVSPGDIANLALSSELAFRANFNGRTIPAYSQLYWRAMTLEVYDGRKWTRTNNTQNSNIKQGAEKTFLPETSGKAIAYQIIAQPSYQPWLFALSVATTTDPKLILKNDYTVQNTSIVNQLRHYEITSYLTAPLALTITPKSRQQNLAIEWGTYPMLETLAQTLKNQYSTPLNISQAVLNHFRQQEYFYSLQPPMLNNNSLEQFYFDTKIGFCVHYASSYTYLMRAAGIPARVVTGYLGGEYNASSSSEKTNEGGHLNIYQYDAHAWSEIWIDGVGWYRVDPTAAVDPERVSQGWSNDLLAQQSKLNNDFFSTYRFKQMAWLNAVRLQLDAIDYQWTRWVLGYSATQQYDLLKRWFGRDMPWKTAVIVALTLIFVMGLFALFYRLSARKYKVRKSPVQSLYNQCLLILEKRGLITSQHCTAQEYLRMVNKNHPKLAADFATITQFFEAIQYRKYDEDTEQALVAQLTLKVNLFLKKVKETQDN